MQKPPERQCHQEAKKFSARVGNALGQKQKQEVNTDRGVHFKNF